MTRHRILAGLTVLALVAGGIAWQAGPGREPKATTQAAPVEPVVELAASDVTRVQPTVLAQGLPISGSLRAVSSAFVKARVAGELLALSVREGDAVQAGQLIGRIDPAESQSRLKQAREQAEAARAQIDIAQRQYDNNRALVDQGFISRTALDTSQSNLLAAQANHRAALAAADVAGKALEDTALRSPIAGTVSQRLAQPGERVAIDAKVVEVVDLRRLELEATLSAADAAQVRIGQQALLRVEGLDEGVKATVVRVNPSAQAASRSVLAYLAVDGGAGLRQGLFAEGRLGTGQLRTLAIPLSALRTDKPAPYVQLVENQRVVHRSVTPGLRGGGEHGEPLVAVSGVPEGSTVLLGHVGPLRDGLAVRFTAPPAGNGAAPRSAP